MKTAAELRSKADKLQDDIKLLIEDFVHDNGSCNLDIQTQMHYVSLNSQTKGLTSVEVTVNVAL